MFEKYRIYQLEPNQIILNRGIDDGMLRKDWYNHPELGECLFKEARPTQAIISESRTDWTEKVVNEIAKLLGLPIAQYELAIGYFGESSELVEGVLSLNCIPVNNDGIFTGEELLARFINYDANNPSQYTIENVLKSLDLANVKPPSNWQQPIPEIDTGAKLFVGYIFLDTLTNNSDRHDHNWGVMSIDDRLELIPSFDHGISLGSTDEDENKPLLSLSDYLNRYSQSCFQAGYNKLPNLTIFEQAAQLYPQAAQIWLNKLAQIDPEQINQIFERIPEGRITPTAATFAKGLIEYNRTELLRPYQLELDKNPVKNRGRNRDSGR
jgi:hypothetical protein